MRRLSAGGAALVAACAGGSSATSGAPRPAPAAPTTTVPTRVVERRAGSEAVRYGPSAVRYLIHRRFHIEQSFGGTPQVQDLGAQFFVRAVITGPADSGGYPATFTVDSATPDSGAPPPVADNLSRLRALVLSGRVAPQGEFKSGAPSDTVLGRTLGQMLNGFHDFLPRVPRGGAQLGASWTDTLSVTQRAGGDVTRRAVQQSRAVAWEDRNGARSLRLETSASYSVSGAGQNGGQFFQISGTGTTTGRLLIAEDGRFLGGESRDSASLALALPAQGLTIPVTQVVHSTVTILP